MLLAFGARGWKIGADKGGLDVHWCLCYTRAPSESFSELLCHFLCPISGILSTFFFCFPRSELEKKSLLEITFDIIFYDSISRNFPKRRVFLPLTAFAVPGGARSFRFIRCTTFHPHARTDALIWRLEHG